MKDGKPTEEEMDALQWYIEQRNKFTESSLRNEVVQTEIKDFLEGKTLVNEEKLGDTVQDKLRNVIAKYRQSMSTPKPDENNIDHIIHKIGVSNEGQRSKEWQKRFEEEAKKTFGGIRK
ncbi:MAG: hypothetical protein R3D71_05050 [Rickettsiales bacterium]